MFGGCQSSSSIPQKISFHFFLLFLWLSQKFFKKIIRIAGAKWSFILQLGKCKYYQVTLTTYFSYFSAIYYSLMYNLAMANFMFSSFLKSFSSFFKKVLHFWNGFSKALWLPPPCCVITLHNFIVFSIIAKYRSQ